MGATQLEPQKLVDSVGRQAVAPQTDVTQPLQCKALVEEAMRAFGRVDVLVNNAGLGSAIPASQETQDQFEAVVAGNLNGSYWITSNLIPPTS